MKKFFLSNLLTLAACLVVSAQEVQSGIPSYDNLQSLAMDALNRQDYKTAYNTYCLMDSVYCKQLKTMCDEDRRLRHLLPKDGTWPDSLRREIQTTDSLNIVRLQELIAQYGFPTYDNVGHQGVNDASLLAQHSEPEFLHWFLEQAKSAADNSNFDLTWIAYMTDRDLDHQDKPQLYGTQGLTRDGLTGMALIDDIEHLNERRKSVGIGPIEDYLPHMDMPDFYFHPSLVDYRQYSQECKRLQHWLKSK